MSIVSRPILLFVGILTLSPAALAPAARAGCVDGAMRTELELADLSARLPVQLRDEFGFSGRVRVAPSGTKPTSGARVFLIHEPGSPEPVAVAKVFQKNSSDPDLEPRALAILDSLGLEKSRTPRFLHQGKVSATGEPLMISAYAGPDLERLVFESARGTKSGARAVEGAVTRLAEALAELHRKGPHLAPDHPEVGIYVDYELGKISRLVADLRGETELRRRLMERAGARAEDLRAIGATLEEAAGAYKAAGVRRPSVIHGDAHPGNFAESAGVPRIFDAPALVGFADGHGDPWADAGRFTAGLMVAALDAGLPVERGRALQALFLDRYLTITGETLESGSAALRFHQLRFYGVALAEVTRDQLKVGNSTRARLIRYLRENF